MLGRVLSCTNNVRAHFGCHFAKLLIYKESCGLQSRVRRFDSDPRLQVARKSPDASSGLFYFRTQAPPWPRCQDDLPHFRIRRAEWPVIVVDRLDALMDGPCCGSTARSVFSFPHADAPDPSAAGWVPRWKRRLVFWCPAGIPEGASLPCGGKDGGHARSARGRSAHMGRVSPERVHALCSSISDPVGFLLCDEYGL